MSIELVKITSAEIDRLHREFLIFGNPKAPYWFLGLEEGDHPKPGEVDKFINGLLKKAERNKKSGMISLRDMVNPKSDYEFLRPIDSSKSKTAAGVKYQRTWGGYIKALLSIVQARDGKQWSLNDIKLYQNYRLGDLDLENDSLGSCLLELFPMARKGRKISQWPYAELADRAGLDYFDKPINYKTKVESLRVKRLLELIDEHKPMVLFAFGADFRDVLLKELPDKPVVHKINTGKRDLTVSHLWFGNSLLFFSNHPTSHGVTNKYWRNLGEKIAEVMQSR